jgi:hypothetical protein
MTPSLDGITPHNYHLAQHHRSLSEGAPASISELHDGESRCYFALLVFLGLSSTHCRKGGNYVENERWSDGTILREIAN